MATTPARRQEVQRLHGDRRRWHRRQVVQHLGVEGPAGGQGARTPNIDIKYVASKAEADYEPNLTQFVNQNCDFILAVGGLMGDATSKVAKANPDQQFAIVDSNPRWPTSTRCSSTPRRPRSSPATWPRA